MGTFLVPIRGVRLRWRSQVTAARFALHVYVYTSLVYECAFLYTSFVSIFVFFVHEPGHACHLYIVIYLNMYAYNTYIECPYLHHVSHI